jgi:hypothetical protein
MIPDMTLIQGAVTSLKAAFDITKGMIQLKSDAEIQVRVIELQSAILAAQSSAMAAQSEQSSMIQRVGQLEEEIARMKAWGEQKKRYKLIHPPWGRGGAMVYALKESCKGSEAAHWICTKCYEDGIRMILQPKRDANGWILLVCPTCKCEINTGYRGISPAEYVED